MRYVVTCGHYKSLHTIAYLYASAEMGIVPSAVIIVRLLSLSRVRTGLRLWGADQLRKKVTALFFLSRDRKQNEGTPVRDWIRERHYASTSDVRKVCKQLGIPTLSCSSLNDQKVIEFLAAQNLDLGVYLGGGILQQDFISAVKNKVLNAHQGPLPEVRGMNAVEWSIYLGLRPTVTVHYIDRGIDTGDVLLERVIPLTKGMNVSEVRGASVVLSVEMLLQAVDLYKKGKLSPYQQDLAKGRQYFTMHPYLLEVLEGRLKAVASKYAET